MAVDIDTNGKAGDFLLIAGGLFRLLQEFDFNKFYDITFKALTLISISLAIVVYIQRLVKNSKDGK